MDYKTPSQYYGYVTPEQKQQAQAAQQQNTYEQQLYNKWYNILTDSALVPGKITVPEDDNEREIACKAATDIMQNKNLEIDLHARANAFARKCQSYIRKRTTQNVKTNLKAQKTGAAGFSQADIQPKSTNMKDVVSAAKNAAEQMAIFYREDNQAGYDTCFALVQPNLSNKAYNVTYYYNFFKNIMDSVTDTAKKQDYTNRMNSLKLQAEQYEMQANNNEFKPGAYDRIKENNQNTTQRVYSK